MQYIDIYDTHEGYELCSGSSESFSQPSPRPGALLGAAQTASSPGDSGPAYEPVTARYTWPWQTLSAWRGTCQRLILTVDDGSTHGAALRFR